MMQCETMCEESDGRSFLTSEEKVAKLEKYQKWLENEKKGVEEAITKIKKAK